jgi:hypothetical protein
MYGRLLSGKRAVALASAGIAICAITGCGSTKAIRQDVNRGGSAGGHPAPLTRAQAKAKAQAEVTNCVNIAGPKAMNSPAGRTTAINCLTGLVSHNKQKALESCLNRAEKRDNIGTATGRLTFETKDGADCVAAKTK